MIELPGIWSLTPYGAILGMLVLAYISIIRGWLVPQASHVRELLLERTRADEWKESTLSEHEVNAELLKQNGMLIASGLKVTASQPPLEQTTAVSRND